MAKKVFNMQGGLHSAAAYSALENRLYGSAKATIDSFVVSAGAGMNASISTGDGLISVDAYNARRIQVTATETATVPAASAAYNRIDSVVAYIDTGVAPTTGVVDNVNDILKFKVVAGTAAATPAAPTGAAIQADIGAGNPYMVLADILLPQNAVNLSGATFTNRAKIIKDTSGWNEITESMSYASWSATTRLGVITVPSGAINRYTPGMRIRITQQTGGTKYGIIVDVTSTTLSVFFPSGTTFTNEAMSYPAFSTQKAPYGFDSDPSLWTLLRIDNTVISKTSPTAGVWWSTGLNLAVPVGSWEIRFALSFAVLGASAGALRGKVTLAMANATEDDPDLTSYCGATAVGVQIGDFSRGKLKKHAAQTTYYLNMQAVNSSASDIQLLGSANNTQIRALCAYL